MYLVSIDVEGEEYLTVKYINQSEKGGCKAIPIVITAIKDANGMTDANSSSNVTNKKETHTRIITFEVSLI